MDSIVVCRILCFSFWWLVVVMVLLLVVMVFGVCQGVKVQLGEIVLLCDVFIWLVYCFVLFGIVLIVELLFCCEIGQVLGILIGMDEFSDDDYVLFGFNIGVGVVYGLIMIECVIGQIVNNILGKVIDNGMLFGGQFSNIIGGLMGVVGNVMCGIGDQVWGVLVQFLFGQFVGGFGK